MRRLSLLITLLVLGGILWLSLQDHKGADGASVTAMKPPESGATGSRPPAPAVGDVSPSTPVDVPPAAVPPVHPPLPDEPPSSHPVNASTGVIIHSFTIHVLDPIEGYAKGMLHAVLSPTSSEGGAPDVEGGNESYSYYGNVEGSVKILLLTPPENSGFEKLTMQLQVERGWYRTQINDFDVLFKGVVTWDLADSCPLPLRKVKALIDGARESFVRGQPDTMALTEITRLLADIKMTEEPYQEFGVMHNAYERLVGLFSIYPNAMLPSSRALVAAGGDWPGLLGVNLACEGPNDTAMRAWVSEGALPAAERLAAPSSPPFARTQAGFMVSALRKVVGVSEKDSIVAAIKDPDPSVRRNSLLALMGVMDKEEAFAYIRELFLTDPDASVQGYAAWCLVHYDKSKLSELWPELEKRAVRGDWNSAAALAAHGHEDSIQYMINSWPGGTNDYYEGGLHCSILKRNARESTLTEAHKKAISDLLVSADPRLKASAAMVALAFDPKAREVLLSCLDADTVIHSRSLFDEVLQTALLTKDASLRLALERVLSKLESQPQRAEAVRQALASIPR